MNQPNLYELCLTCELKVCDDKSPKCGYNNQKKKYKQVYSARVAEQQKAYRQRNKQAYREYWLKAYYKRKEKHYEKDQTMD